MIERLGGTYPPGRSASTGYRDLVWTVAAASDESLDLSGQTGQALNTLENNLIELGSDKTRLLAVHVFIANIDDKPIMDKVWQHWIGDNPKHWPQRACLGVDLGGNWLIEITATAVKTI